MDKESAEKHAAVTFDDSFCALYADIIKQDVSNIKVLFYIASCEQTATPVTVKTITDNVKTARRVAVKDGNNAVVRFDNKDDYIDRKTAERIVDRLAYAALIYYDVQRPFKFIRLTDRGVQVAIYIKKSMGGK